MRGLRRQRRAPARERVEPARSCWPTARRSCGPCGVAPGIDFKYDLYEGYDEHIAATRIPHAYKAGPQTQLLKKQVEAMPEGGTFIICPPPNPFRCPPGPYERVSMVARYFKQHKPKPKILILDAKDKHSKMALFQEAWERTTPGWSNSCPAEFTGGGIASVDAGA